MPKHHLLAQCRWTAAPCSGLYYLLYFSSSCSWWHGKKDNRLALTFHSVLAALDRKSA